MSSYGPLARYYDRLTRDVSYAAFADYYESAFKADGGEFKIILDLCCGVGALTCELAQRGYELISVDASEEMLMAAREKTAALKGVTAPLLICQDAAELDLYGTVDAALSSLDSLSYIPPGRLPAVFGRLRLFVRPGGLLIFDLRTPEFLRFMDGQAFVDESDELLCLWRGAFDEKRGRLSYGLDLFEREGGLWRRESEEHFEYAHEPAWVRSLLIEKGFSSVEINDSVPAGGPGRVFFAAK